MIKINSLVDDIDFQFLLGIDSSPMNIAQNRYGLIDFLLISSALSPELLVMKDAIFISEFYGNTNFINLDRDCNGDSTLMEKMINTKQLSYFFLLEGHLDDIANENEDLLLKFGNVLKFFWQNWLREKFPEKIFIIEVGKNLFPEEALAITVYQERVLKISQPPHSVEKEAG